MTMTRKEFLRSLVKAGVGAAGVAALAGATGCGGDDSSGTVDAAPPTCATSSTVIQANHGHVMMVAKADVDAAVAKTYDIMGSALHTHMVTISASQFAMLATGAMLTLTSTSEGTHTHTVTVMCLT